jgi:beta-glucanase (GH16 family)
LTQGPAEFRDGTAGCKSSSEFGKYSVKMGTVGFLMLISVLLNGCKHQASEFVPSAENTDRKWTLTWDDEFTGPNGSSPDPAKWVIESGGNGWGNEELEYYTPRQENLRLENGNLVIEAMKENFVGSDGVRRRYTSARVTTKGRFTQMYGRFEARVQIPPGQGTWPAFWLMGDDYTSAGWPACGEIDVMENVDTDKSRIRVSIHGPGYSARQSVTSSFSLPHAQFSDMFHVFAMEWEPRAIRFYVDDELYSTMTPANLPGGAPWVFNHPFFIILNLAVGGNLPASPDISTEFPQRMLVDYVRVYSRR